ncbi:unnamed protein product [Trichobilharzia regenti]|uniref:GATA zinc finger domain-containing protein 14-like n=1 Tax=Trichobilharzia regenti TaxID=157069 RepID=A0A183WCW0_TRIRE|nr:unnamed protein product [Trichobilharzia regenti]VDQ05843.1 unnamed protein product [Trichobilharzia regenti]
MYLLILILFTWTYTTHGVIHTSFHKHLIPYYYDAKSYRSYYLNKRYTTNNYYSYYRPLTTWNSYHYPYKKQNNNSNSNYYRKSNYQLIPSVEKLKFIETETKTETKEYNDIRTEHRKNDESTLRAQMNYNSTLFTGGDKSDEKLVGQSSHQQYDQKRISGDKATLSGNDNNGPIGYTYNKYHHNYYDNYQKNIKPQSNNNPYLSRSFLSKLKGKYHYDRQVIKQREALYYLVIRQPKKYY